MKVLSHFSKSSFQDEAWRHLEDKTGPGWRRGIKARTRQKLTHLAAGFPEEWVNSERAFAILHERIAASAYSIVGGNYQYFTKCVDLDLLEVRKTGGRLQWRRKAAEST